MRAAALMGQISVQVAIGLNFHHVSLHAPLPTTRCFYKSPEVGPVLLHDQWDAVSLGRATRTPATLPPPFQGAPGAHCWVKRRKKCLRKYLQGVLARLSLSFSPVRLHTRHHPSVSHSVPYPNSTVYLSPNGLLFQYVITSHMAVWLALWSARRLPRPAPWPAPPGLTL